MIRLFYYFMLVLIVHSTSLIAYLIGIDALGRTGTQSTGGIYVIKNYECDVTDEGQTTKLFVSTGAPRSSLVCEVTSDLLCSIGYD